LSRKLGDHSTSTRDLEVDDDHETRPSISNTTFDRKPPSTSDAAIAKKIAKRVHEARDSRYGTTTPTLEGRKELLSHPMRRLAERRRRDEAQMFHGVPEQFA
jgi:hypothetical protein